MLLGAGADPLIENDMGKTAYQIAAVNSEHQDSCMTMKDLIGSFLPYTNGSPHRHRSTKEGAITARDFAKIHLKVLWNQIDDVVKLLKIGCPVDYLDEKGRTPLHVACLSKHAGSDMISLLLDSGADVKAQCDRGMRADMICLKTQRLELAVALYNCQAGPVPRPPNGCPEPTLKINNPVKKENLVPLRVRLSDDVTNFPADQEGKPFLSSLMHPGKPSHPFRRPSPRQLVPKRSLLKEVSRVSKRAETGQDNQTCDDTALAKIIASPPCFGRKKSHSVVSLRTNSGSDESSETIFGMANFEHLTVIGNHHNEGDIICPDMDAMRDAGKLHAQSLLDAEADHRAGCFPQESPKIGTQGRRFRPFTKQANNALGTITACAPGSTLPPDCRAFDGSRSWNHEPGAPKGHRLQQGTGTRLPARSPTHTPIPKTPVPSHSEGGPEGITTAKRTETLTPAPTLTIFTPAPTPAPAPAPGPSPTHALAQACASAPSPSPCPAPPAARAQQQDLPKQQDLPDAVPQEPSPSPPVPIEALRQEMAHILQVHRMQMHPTGKAGHCPEAHQIQQPSAAPLPAPAAAFANRAQAQATPMARSSSQHRSHSAPSTPIPVRRRHSHAYRPSRPLQRAAWDDALPAPAPRQHTPAAPELQGHPMPGARANQHQEHALHGHGGGTTPSTPGQPMQVLGYARHHHQGQHPAHAPDCTAPLANTLPHGDVPIFGLTPSCSEAPGASPTAASGALAPRPRSRSTGAVPSVPQVYGGRSGRGHHFDGGGDGPRQRAGQRQPFHQTLHTPAATASQWPYAGVTRPDPAALTTTTPTTVQRLMLPDRQEGPNVFGGNTCWNGQEAPATSLGMSQAQHLKDKIMQIQYENNHHPAVLMQEGEGIPSDTPNTGGRPYDANQQGYQHPHRHKSPSRSGFQQRRAPTPAAVGHRQHGSSTKTNHQAFLGTTSPCAREGNILTAVKNQVQQEHDKLLKLQRELTRQAYQ
eukprot:gene6277-1120_t